MKPTSRRRTVIACAVAATVIAANLLGATPRAAAQDTIQPDKTDLFPDAMLAYRLGNYYLVRGDTERAIAYLTEAIALLPPVAFTLDAGYADIYWILGEALEGSGRYGEALTNYQYFLALAGDHAPRWTVEKVMLLAARYGAMAALTAHT